MATPTSNSVSVTAVTTPSDSLVAALLVGSQWGETGEAVSLTYSFPTNDDFFATDYSFDDEWKGFSALSAEEQAEVEEALADWSAVANVTFTKVAESAASVGELRVAKSAVVSDSDSVARGYYPGNQPSAGDIWLSPDAYAGDAIPEGWPQYKTLMHEIGHALGLKHSFDDFDGTLAVVPEELDFYHYTIMSYDALPGGGVGASMFPTTPMLLDIAAMQYLYGANMGWHTGDDVYAYSFDGKYLETIWDAGGNDTITFEGRNGALIDLNDGEFSQLGQAITYSNGAEQLDTVAIAFGAIIENAVGGDGADTLVGNEAANQLTGGIGADTLTGGGGADSFVYKSLDDGGDVVTDFTLGDDQLAVSAAAFTANGFAFDNASDALVYNGTVMVTLAGLDNFDSSALTFF